jgi:hypothetical protein
MNGSLVSQADDELVAAREGDRTWVNLVRMSHAVG